MGQQYESNTIRIIGPKKDAVGTGILIGPAHLLTCTHVVALAQGDPTGMALVMERPIRFDMPLLRPRPGGTNLLAMPRICRPVRDQPLVGDGSDIALLEVLDPDSLPAQAMPARIQVAEQAYDREAVAFGFERWEGDHVRLNLLGINATGNIQAEQGPGYRAVGRGFSGAGVRDPRTWALADPNGGSGQPRQAAEAEDRLCHSLHSAAGIAGGGRTRRPHHRA